MKTTTTTTPTTASKLTYTTTGGKVTVYECRPENAIGDLVIPDTIKGNPVTSIGRGAFAHCPNLTSVVIPDGVTRISDGAFFNSKSLTSITIPESVKSIGDNAFHNCKALKHITIPEGARSGFGIVSGCDALQSITIHGTKLTTPEGELANLLGPKY